MRAAILTAIGQPLKLLDLALPKQPNGMIRLSVGQVHIRVKYSGICGAQLGEIAGAKGEDRFLPHCLGHEGVGTVVSIGDGVKTVSVGDTVVMHWRPSLGIQSDPASYQSEIGTVSAGWVTTFQEEAIVSENRLTVLPHGIDEKVAPLLGCALTTALGVVENDAAIKPGQSVLIFGAGGVGLAIVMMARLVSPSLIVAVDPVVKKMTAATDRGANVAVENIGDGSQPFDVVIDTTGRSEVIQQAYELTKPQGRTILVGVPRHDDPITIHSLPLHFGKILKGSHGGHSQPHLDIPRLAKLVRAGLLNLDGLVTHEFPLEQINDAIALVRSGEAGRVLLRMS